MPAVELLLEKDEEKARKLASDLRNINSERQEQTKEYEQVIEELQTKGKEYYDFGIVVQSDAFHIGIAGLVAGKLCEAYYRPSIALAPIEKEGEVVLKGSARSIPGVHVLRMLDKVKEKIGDYEYGGHEQAAGMTLRATETQTLEERFEAFRVAFREACMEHDAEIFTPCVNYDAEVEFVDISFDFIELLKKLEPFGEGNRRPLFRANNVKISNLKGIMEGKGVRFTFKQDKTILNGIMFKDGEFIIPEYQKKLMGGEECMVDLLFHPEINRWNGNSSIQLQIQDVKFH
jgi:single-stranded-DNA-specific exonuclease